MQRVRISITEGISENPSRFDTVRVFFDNDYSYGYFCNQLLVEGFIGQRLKVGNDVHYISIEDANILIAEGDTVGEKRYYTYEGE